jgi:hypothetical protein
MVLYTMVQHTARRGEQGCLPPYDVSPYKWLYKSDPSLAGYTKMQEKPFWLFQNDMVVHYHNHILTGEDEVRVTLTDAKARDTDLIGLWDPAQPQNAVYIIPTTGHVVSQQKGVRGTSCGVYDCDFVKLGSGTEVDVLALSVKNGHLMVGLDGEEPLSVCGRPVFDAKDWVLFFGNREEHHANEWAGALHLDIKDRMPIVVPERTSPIGVPKRTPPTVLETPCSKRCCGASSSLDGDSVINEAKGAQEEPPVEKQEWAWSVCTECGVPDCCLRCTEMCETVSALREEITDLKTKINRMSGFARLSGASRLMTESTVNRIKVEDK